METDETLIARLRARIAELEEFVRGLLGHTPEAQERMWTNALLTEYRKAKEPAGCDDLPPLGLKWKEVGTAKMVRNPEATCTNCPFCRIAEDKDGHRFEACRRHAPNAHNGNSWEEVVPGTFWCGEHPDFWMQELPKETNSQ